MVKDRQSVRGVNGSRTDWSLSYSCIDQWFAGVSDKPGSPSSRPIYSTSVPKSASRATRPLTRSIAVVWDFADNPRPAIIPAFGGHAVTTCKALFSAKNRSALRFW